MKIRVSYNKWVGIALITLSIINWFLCLLIVLGGGNPMRSFIPALLILSAGVSYLTRPYFLLINHQLVIPALWGPLQKTYSLEKPEEIAILQNRIYLNQKKIKLYPWLANHKDWQNFLDKIHQF